MEHDQETIPPTTEHTPKPRKRCPHGRPHSRCKECGGSEICEHRRRRSYCKDCGGSQICEHNRQRSHCGECGGIEICEHNRQRSYCKDCGGVGICEHNRQRQRCSRCHPEGAYKKLKRDAKGREIPFELTLDEYKWLVSPESKCLSCGEASEPLGVDRVHNDHNIGYRFDNVQPFCGWCNRMKLDYSEEEFDQHLTKIFKHRPELTGVRQLKRELIEAQQVISLFA